MRRRSEEQPVSDINITPLTDVMLVLLIIFMISSPVLMSKGIEVHLPQVEVAQQLVEEDHVIYISADGTLQLDGKIYTDDKLQTAFIDLVSVADETGEVVNLFLRGDESITYDRLTRVMDMATSAGIERISLVQDVVEGDAETVASEPGETERDVVDLNTEIPE